MRALSVGPGGRFGWKGVAAPPPPEPDAAIMRPVAVATCDLDRPAALGATPFVLPLHYGHERVASMISIGDRWPAQR